MVWLCLELLEERAGDLELKPYSRRLRPPRPVRAALRWLVPDSLGTRLNGMHHRVQAAVFWPLMFDTPLHLIRFVATHPVTRMLKR